MPRDTSRRQAADGSWPDPVRAASLAYHSAHKKAITLLARLFAEAEVTEEEIEALRDAHQRECLALDQLLAAIRYRRQGSG